MRLPTASCLIFSLTAAALFSISGSRALALDPTEAPGQNFNLGNFDLQAWPCNGGNDTQLSPGQIATFQNSSYFYTGGDGSMVMWCPDEGGCATSTNTTHQRTELRDLTDWFVTDGKTHIETATCKVLQQPRNGSTIIGQIHGDVPVTGGEALKLRWLNGNLVAGIKITEGGSEIFGQFSPVANASLGDTIAYTLQEQNSVVTVTVTINGGSAHTYTYTLDSSWTTIPLYFKAGNYNQDATDGTVDGALVAFYALDIQPKVGTPAFSPLAGAYTTTQPVAISSTTSGASIAYTMDGSTPTEAGGSVTHGTLYTGAVSIGGNTTLNAIAFKSGMTDSILASGGYTISIPGVTSAPTFGPAAGTYGTAQSVTIGSTTGGASVAYTTDGSTPTEVGGSVTHGTLYSGAISVSSPTTLKAIAFATGLTDSTVAAAAYTINIQAATPVFGPVAGIYTSTQFVAISSATSGAAIAYTTDGSTPTEVGGTVTHGALYSGAISLSSTTALKAIAFKTGLTDSTAAAAAYTINISGTQTTLLNDTFNSGPSGALPAGAQNLSASAEWFEVASLNNIETYTSGSPGSLLLNVGSNSAGALAYFTAAGSPQALAIGGTLTATFNFSTIPGGTTLGNGFRVAVLNSGNQQITGNTLTSSTSFAGYTGFMASFDPNSGQGAGSLYARTSGTSTTLINTIGSGGTATYTPFVTGISTTPGLASGSPYQGILTLQRTAANAMTVSLQIDDLSNSGAPISGYTLSASSSPTITTIATAFDTFVIGANSNGMTSFSLTGLNVTYVSPQAAMPTFSPVAGNYTSAQSVTISSATGGASIAYTLDGSAPVESNGTVTHGTLYSGAVAINSTTTVNAIAFEAGLADSPVTTNITYNITLPTAATPTFSPVAGTYASAQSVTISSATSGASVVYTLDGSPPTESGGVATNGTLYSTPVSVTTTTTLNAIAFKLGADADSPVATAAYTLTLPLAATPTFSPVAGTYTSVQSVTLSSATSGASFVYTVDGSPPTESSGVVTNGILYSAPVPITTTTTLNAIAFAGGFNDSAVASGLYTINFPSVVATPTFSPAAGIYTAAQSVTISSTTGGALFAYTTDGSTPAEVAGTVTHGTLYSGPVAINSTAVLKAIAFETGFVDSAMSTAAYTINSSGTASAPTFSPIAGTFTSSQAVTISDITAGTSIRYTIDGSTPTETVGTLYSGPVSIGGTTTLKAIAYEASFFDSAVSTAVYTIQTPSTPSPSPAPSGGGGGGAFDEWFLGTLAALSVWRWRRTRH